METKALVVIDLQNDMTKNYQLILDNVNNLVGWAVENKIHVIYIRHEFLSEEKKIFRPNTYGAELIEGLKIVSNNIFIKNSGSITTSNAFMKFITENNIGEFYLTGGDATECIKASNDGLHKLNYKVNVVADGIISHDMTSITEMLDYYQSKGSKIINTDDLLKG